MDYKDTYLYKNDTIGLKQLDDENKIVRLEAPDFYHNRYKEESGQPWLIENVYPYAGVEK